MRPQGGHKGRPYFRFIPSPPWGRGWPAAGAFISRGGPGEGVLPDHCTLPPNLPIERPPCPATRTFCHLDNPQTVGYDAGVSQGRWAQNRGAGDRQAWKPETQNSGTREVAWPPPRMRRGPGVVQPCGLACATWFLMTKTREQSQNVYENKGRGQKFVGWRRRCL